MNNPYILPKNIKPISYDINFTLDMNKLSFSGEETIKLKVIKPTKEIKINADGIKITSAGTNGNEFSGIKYEKEVVAITFKNQIKTDIDLFLKFNGKLREDMRGFYKSNYNVNGKEKIMATTQFEPSDARKAFPCFDEPNLKTKCDMCSNCVALEMLNTIPMKINENYATDEEITALSSLKIDINSDEFHIILLKSVGIDKCIPKKDFAKVLNGTLHRLSAKWKFELCSYNILKEEESKIGDTVNKLVSDELMEITPDGELRITKKGITTLLK